MKKSKKKMTVLNGVLVIAMVLITTVGITYAFFSANLTGAESETTITISGGKMDIAFVGGSKITASGAFPQAAAIATKSMTVTGTNTTSTTMPYKLTLNVTANTFSATALKYQLASTNTGNNGTLVPAKTTNQNIATGPSNIALGNGSFTGPTGGAKVHTYVLTIYFPDTGGDQNADQGKTFSAFVKIENV